MLAQKMLLGYGSRILAQMFGMVVGVFVARLAGPHVLGTAAFGLSFVSMFQFLADMGTGSAHVKLVSEGRDIAKCIGTFSRIRYVLIAIFLCSTLTVVLIEYAYFPSLFETPEHFIVVLVSIGVVGFTQIGLIPVSTFLALTEQAKQDVPSLIQSVMVQVLRLVAVILGFGAIGLNGAQLVGAVFLFLAYYFLYTKYPNGVFERAYVSDYVRLAIPIFIIGFCSTQMDSIDKVLLQYSSNSEQVGYYTAGLSLSGFLKTIGTTGGMLFFPIFSSAVSRRDFAYINNVLNKFERFAFVFMFPCVILVMFFSRQIIQLVLGTQYAPSVPVLAITFAGMFLYVVNIPYGNAILALGKFRLGAMLQISGLVLFVATDLLVLRMVNVDHSAMGTALAVAASTSLLGFSFRVSVSKLSRQIKVWTNLRFLVALPLLAGFGLGIGLLANAFVHDGINPCYVGALIFAAGCATLYAGLGWLTKDDVQLLGETVKLNKVIHYVRSEITIKKHGNRVE